MNGTSYCGKPRTAEWRKLVVKSPVVPPAVSHTGEGEGDSKIFALVKQDSNCGPVIVNKLFTDWIKGI